MSFEDSHFEGPLILSRLQENYYQRQFLQLNTESFTLIESANAPSYQHNLPSQMVIWMSHALVPALDDHQQSVQACSTILLDYCSDVQSSTSDSDGTFQGKNGKPSYSAMERENQVTAVQQK